MSDKKHVVVIEHERFQITGRFTTQQEAMNFDKFIKDTLEDEQAMHDVLGLLLPMIRSTGGDK